MKTLKKKLNEISKIARNSYEIIREEGIRPYLTTVKEKIERREFKIIDPITFIDADLIESGNLHVSKLILPGNDELENASKISVKVSVVIPTNSSVQQLKPCLESIQKQKGVKDFEIILVNSGNHNLTSLENSNTRVFNIKQNEFQHGKTRNLGAGKSTGDFIVFTTDDAVFASDWIVYKMVKTLSEDLSIGAATGRQFQRKNDDIMYALSMKQYYRDLKLNHDRIVFSEDFSSLSQQEKNMLVHIDDVCSCYRREKFMENMYADIDFAEDLEMGIRLAKKGMKIAQLFSDGVYHSHTRDASYYLKRHYISIITYLKLLGSNRSVIFDIKTIDDLSHQVLPLYNSFCFSLDKLEPSMDSLSLEDGFKMIRKNIKKMPVDFQPKNTDETLDEIFKKIFNDLDIKSEKYDRNNFFYRNFYFALRNLSKTINELNPNMKNMNEEVVQTLFKKFASILGWYLGSFYFYKMQNKKEFEPIHQFLTKGV